MREETWRTRAKCFDMDTNLFFSSDVAGVNQAKAICKGLDGAPPCPVIAQCLSHALSQPVTHDQGVMGGKSERERRQMRRISRQASKPV